MFRLPDSFASRAPIRATYAPIIAAYLANGGRVAKYDPRGQRIA